MGPLQTSSTAVALSSDVLLPSFKLDYRQHRSPSGFSQTFTGSWHLTEAGFEPMTIDYKSSPLNRAAFLLGTVEGDKAYMKKEIC